MKLGQFYKRAIECGSKYDPRGGECLFEDTGILYGSEDSEIKNVLVGIDITSAELMFVEALRAGGVNVDLVVSHRPRGEFLRRTPLLLRQHESLLARLGVGCSSEFFEKESLNMNLTIRESLLRREEQIAQLMKVPFMCIHSPADNIAAHILATRINPGSSMTVKSWCLSVAGIWSSLGPEVFCGCGNCVMGRTYFDVIGGNPLPSELFSHLKKGGIDTIVATHISNERIDKAKDVRINLISVSHVDLDSLGMHELIKRIDPEGELNIIKCGGFYVPTLV